MATGVGIDVLRVDRLERALARRPRIAERLFTAAERSYAAGRVRPAQHLAARFCAKEAVAKALRLQSWSHLEIEVVGGGAAAPEVRLRGAVADHAERAGAGPVLVSLSHDGPVAAATALAL